MNVVHDRMENACTVRSCKYLPLSHTKALGLGLCMGKREELTVHTLSVLSCVLLIGKVLDFDETF